MSKKSKKKGIKLRCNKVYEWKAPDMSVGYRLWAKSKKQAKKYIEREVIPGQRVKKRHIERVGFPEPHVLSVMNSISAKGLEETADELKPFPPIVEEEAAVTHSAQQ